MAGVNNLTNVNQEIVLNWHDVALNFANQCNAALNGAGPTNYNLAVTFPRTIQGTLEPTFDAYDTSGISQGETSNILAAERNRTGTNSWTAEDTTANTNVYENAGAGTQGSVATTVDFEITDGMNNDFILSRINASGGIDYVLAVPDGGTDAKVRAALQSVVDNADL